jgi:hypothetical protein
MAVSKKEKKRNKRFKKARLEAEALESTRLVIATAQLEMLRHLEHQAANNPISVGYFRAMIRNIHEGRAPEDFDPQDQTWTPVTGATVEEVVDDGAPAAS